MNQAQNVTATFSSYQLTVTLAGTNGGGVVRSLPSGIDCGTTCSASFASGTQVRLDASTVGDNYFAGWSGACSGTSTTCIVTMSQAQNVTADFEPGYGLDIRMGTAGNALGAQLNETVTSPAGVDCIMNGSVAGCHYEFPPGTTLTLTAAAPANGATGFVWGGACSGSSLTCTLTLNSDQSVTATYT
jgi:hypothetical protein